MPKSALIQLPLVITSLDLKKHILLFDRLIFVKENYSLGMQLLNYGSHTAPDVFMERYKSINRDIEFLIEKNLIKFISVDDFIDFENEDLESEVKVWLKTSDKSLFDDNLNLRKDIVLKDIGKLMNFLVRVCSLIYSYKYQQELIPVIDGFDASNTTRKTSIYKFLMQSIPEPEDNVAWEQIIDFKSDSDTQKKYYRLLNWINEVSKGELSINEIEEKYKALLFEYTDAFRIHKMKYNLGLIEVATKIVTEIASLKFTKAHQTFFSIFKEEVNLLEAEAKFEGKQIAYIHKLNKNF